MGSQGPGKRVLICGGRDYEDKEEVAKVFDMLEGRVHRDLLLIIEGGAKGADTLAREEAKRRGIHVATVPALWDVFKNGAGQKRNLAMARLLEPDVVIAFPGGRGTGHMVRVAGDNNIRVMDKR